MKTDGIGAFQQWNRGLVEKARQALPSPSEKLSADEQKMIRNEFKAGSSPLELYSSRGESASEHPGAKGGTIDFTV